jgi:hypothetical protein
MKVDALAKRTASAPQSYALKSKDPQLGEENLRYREAAELMRTALSGKGLYEAPVPEKADVIVELDFGMDSPQTKIETVTRPLMAQVDGGVRYETVPIVDQRGNTSMRTVPVYQPPRTEVVAYEDVYLPVSVYEKYLRVTARENNEGVEGRPPTELWSVNVSAVDGSKDLRKYLPVMAAVTADYIGKETGHEKAVNVRENSAAVDFIKRGLPDNTAVTVQSTARPGS